MECDSAIGIESKELYVCGGKERKGKEGIDILREGERIVGSIELRLNRPPIERAPAVILESGQALIGPDIVIGQ
jgi:hypothetical protein